MYSAYTYPPTGLMIALFLILFFALGLLFYFLTSRQRLTPGVALCLSPSSLRIERRPDTPFVISQINFRLLVKNMGTESVVVTDLGFVLKNGRRVSVTALPDPLGGVSFPAPLAPCYTLAKYFRLDTTLAPVPYITEAYVLTANGGFFTATSASLSAAIAAGQVVLDD